MDRELKKIEIENKLANLKFDFMEWHDRWEIKLAGVFFTAGIIFMLYSLLLIAIILAYWIVFFTVISIKVPGLAALYLLFMLASFYVSEELEKREDTNDDFW